MDKYIKEQYENMLKRLDTKTSDFIKEIKYFEGNTKEALEIMKKIYKDELEVFAEMYVQE